MKKNLYLNLAFSCLMFAPILASHDVPSGSDHDHDHYADNDMLDTSISVERISGQDLAVLITNRSKAIVINVLGKNCYGDCHIRSSFNVPLRFIAERAEYWNRDQAIVVYCALPACDASQKAARKLKKMGFKNVLAYEGGMRDWYLAFKDSRPDLIEGICEYDYLQLDFEIAKNLDALEEDTSRCPCSGKPKPKPPVVKPIENEPVKEQPKVEAPASEPAVSKTIEAKKPTKRCPCSGKPKPKPAEKPPVETPPVS